MGEVVGAGIVSHVPTIMLPEETRRELNNGKEISLVPGFHRLREEVLNELKPDTFIVFDTHCHRAVCGLSTLRILSCRTRCIQS